MLEEITIEIQCPLCGQIHEYPQTVMSTGVLYGGIDSEQKPKAYMRVFTCPEKDQTFEVIVEERSTEEKLCDSGIF